MTRCWVLLLIALAGCKGKGKSEGRSGGNEPPVPPEKKKAVPPEPGREITSPLPEKGPHPDYPTAAAAGTDKIFFLEEPDRGPKAPASYTPPPRDSLTWTAAPYCEVTELAVACSKGKTEATYDRVGRGKNVVIVETVQHEQVDTTTVYLANADGTPAQRLTLDRTGAVTQALLFTTAGRYTGRREGGSNALPGCGMHAFTADKQGRMTELRCLQWLGDPMRDTDGIAIRRYTYDKDGFVADEKRFDLDDKPIADITGVHRVVYARTPSGRIASEAHFGVGGAAVVDTSGCATNTNIYTNGDLTGTVCKDASDRPAKTGVAQQVYEVDAHGCTTRASYRDAAGKSVANDLGIEGMLYDVDDRCHKLAETCLGPLGAPGPCGPGQPSRWAYGVDARGRMTSAKAFDEKGNAATDASYHVHETRYVLDAAGNHTQMTCHTTNGSMVTCGSTGFAGWKLTFDDAGRRQTQTFFDERGAPATNLGTSQRKFRFDNYDHEFEALGLDVEGNLIVSNGMAIRRNLWDASHRLFAVQLLDADRKPARYSGCYTGTTCPDKPWHAVRINRRPNGSVSTNQFFDADGQHLETIDCTAKPCFDQN